METTIGSLIAVFYMLSVVVLILAGEYALSDTLGEDALAAVVPCAIAWPVTAPIIVLISLLATAVMAVHKAYR